MWNPGFILIIVIAVVGMIVQARLQSVFKKYSQVMFPGGLTGREVAEKIYKRHCFFTEQLIAAGVDPKTAEADACRIEHIISDESFSRLKEAAEQEQT